MVKWNKEAIIEANIEKVWELFQDRNIKQIMPKIEEHQLLENNDDEAGAKHAQTYYEGSQLQTYIVETLAYDDTPDRKHRQIRFIMGQSFEVMYSFTLLKAGENRTKFIYQGHNKGVNLVGKAMLLAGNKKKAEETVTKFMERVELAALNND
ncbi:SRPBCC family protein [Planococcus salinus]|uniref:SRPBCC family protein n=1 Tax=Planococcus salinus TaxID=1848460 RepID=A0A3M8PE51_9BACL|nr:SRPBCC family protein [Planococcus salinus]RNF41144.1 SRPBCC family protein [Planococcus salinus]